MTQKNKDIETNKHTALSIQISLNGLSFCILESTTKTISFLKHIIFSKRLNPFEVLDYLKKTFETEKALHIDFNHVTLLHVNELSTLVPKALFNEESLADYLKFNAKILRSDFITFDDIAINNSVNVYVPYVNINNYIFDKFGKFDYKHFSTVLIERLLDNEKHTESTKMFAHISLTHFELIVIQNGNLLLYNSFSYKTKEDFIYFVLFTIEQLNLNPDTLQLVLLGQVIKNDALYKIAYKYIRHVNFYNSKDTYHFTTPPITNHSDFAIINSF